MSWIYANKIVTTMVRTMSTIERISKSLTNGKVTILVNVRKPKKREQEYIDNLLPYLSMSNDYRIGENFKIIKKLLQSGRFH